MHISEYCLTGCINGYQLLFCFHVLFQILAQILAHVICVCTMCPASLQVCSFPLSMRNVSQSAVDDAGREAEDVSPFSALGQQSRIPCQGC